ncbi:histidinol-phosphate transaminase [Gammaproteobacteria bacterium]|nr:histidinol-phosphate transaminase [Gammaproteobacteria bacterium]MDC1511348.1 histidinol-phosphate transaminase [Gammaproteobacteria bacterium]
MTLERSNIAAMQGYAPGEQPQDLTTIKLNTNENPYPPSPEVAAALSAFDVASLRRYPNPIADEFRLIAADLHGLSLDNVIPTNGGDELLRLMLTTFVAEGEVVATTKPTYSLYPVLAAIQGAKLSEIDLDEQWRLPSDLIQQLHEIKAKAFILVNPHAPTGGLVSSATIAGIAENFDGVLVVDEAYIDFVDPDLEHNCVPLLQRFDNLLILRTMSKGYSLAGLRFGYGLAAKKLAAPMLFKTRDSYNTDAISQRLAAAALASQSYAKSTWNKVRKSREKMFAELTSMGLTCLASQSNFLLCTIPESIGAPRAYAALKEKGVLVRYFDQDRLRDKLRISIGTEEENSRLIQALTDLCRSES